MVLCLFFIVLFLSAELIHGSLNFANGDYFTVDLPFFGGASGAAATVCSWLKLRSETARNMEVFRFDSSTSTSIFHKAWVGWRYDTINGWGIDTSVGGSGRVFYVPTPISINVWFHFCATFTRDPVDNRATIAPFWNGIPQSTGTSRTLPIIPDRLVLGDETGIEPFDGLLDELHVFSEVISTCDIQKIAGWDTASVQFRSSHVGWFQFGPSGIRKNSLSAAGSLGAISGPGLPVYEPDVVPSSLLSGSCIMLMPTPTPTILSPPPTPVTSSPTVDPGGAPAPTPEPTGVAASPTPQPDREAGASSTTQPNSWSTTASPQLEGGASASRSPHNSVAPTTPQTVGAVSQPQQSDRQSQLNGSSNVNDVVYVGVGAGAGGICITLVVGLAVLCSRRRSSSSISSRAGDVTMNSAVDATKSRSRSHAGSRPRSRSGRSSRVVKRQSVGGPGPTPFTGNYQLITLSSSPESRTTAQPITGSYHSIETLPSESTYQAAPTQKHHYMNSPAGYSNFSAPSSSSTYAPAVARSDGTTKTGAYVPLSEAS